MTDNKYSFRLHVTIAEIQQRVDSIISKRGYMSEHDFLDALEEQIHRPLLEHFENRPERNKHSAFKRSWALGYVAGRLKQQHDVIGG